MPIPQYSNRTLNFASGDEGTRQTLETMKIAAREGMKDPAVLPIARRLVLDVPEKDKWNEALQLFRYVKDEIRYVNDPLDLEAVVFPRQTMEFQSGDCDDKSVLFAALAETLGIPARFVAVKLPGKPIYTHVYPELYLNERWQPFELTLAYAKPGVSYAPQGSIRMVVEVTAPEETGDVLQRAVQAIFGALRGN